MSFSPPCSHPSWCAGSSGTQEARLQHFHQSLLKQARDMAWVSKWLDLHDLRWLIGFNLITDSEKSILKIQRGHKMFQLHWTVDDVWLLSLWFLKLSLFAKHAEDAKVVFHDSNIFKWNLRNHFFPGNGICFVPPSSTPPKYTKIEGLRCKLHKCQGSDICTVCPEMSKNGSNMVKQSGNTLYSKMSRAGDLCTVVNML